MANPATSFDTERFDEATVESAAARTARILAGDSPAPQSAAQPTLHAPAGHPSPPAPQAAPPADPEPKRQRMTVGKLAERYQERIAEITGNIEKMGAIVATYQKKLEEHKSALAVWQQALDEIKAV